MRGSCDRERRFGLNRARLALVGDWKDARFVVEAWSSAAPGTDASAVTKVVGEVLRRLAGEDSIEGLVC